MKLSMVYDNEAKEGLKSDWGFSCLIESGDRKLLLDTGASGDILAYNMQQLGLRKEDIEIIALSHEHGDHTGGLGAVLHPGIAVYLPRSFSRILKKNVAEKAARVVEVSEPKEIIPGVHTTGELGLGIKEQSLVLDTEKGMVVLTGCAHPGLENILEAATVFGELYGVIGGFQGFDKRESLQGLELIMPCHCTIRKKEILGMYPKKTVRCGAGGVIEL
ncbi:MAG TPA: MBL fold metallo-hydrolase [Candidatus Bathyarchaeia archaeon]|nr:MBL fold metallo-hydrolase [Candidatus Bathyarchaeia archaeon]